MLVLRHEQFSVLGGVRRGSTDGTDSSPPGHLVQQGYSHADMLPGPNRTTPTCADDFSSGTRDSFVADPGTAVSGGDYVDVR